jgi:hypothetical protein
MHQYYFDMTSESEILDYFLPSVLHIKIFSQFLSLKDISQFDVAICNKIRRLLFLEIVGSESCIWLGHKTQNLDCDAISWLKTRSIKVRHLMCNRFTYNTAIKINEFGSCLHWLRIKDENLVDKV